MTMTASLVIRATDRDELEPQFRMEHDCLCQQIGQICQERPQETDILQIEVRAPVLKVV